MNKLVAKYEAEVIFTLVCVILTVVRHGATDSNTQSIAPGSTDTPLHDLGIKQAKFL